MEPIAKKRMRTGGEGDGNGNRYEKTEARFQSAGFLKKIVNAVKDLITDANFDFTNEGICLQAMDSAHVSLVHVVISADDCSYYKCDRAISLGMNIANLVKVMGCGGNDDVLTMCSVSDPKSDEQVKFSFESKKLNKVTVLSLKLIDIEQEALRIPEREYDAVVTMTSGEFQRICRDMTVFGDAVRILVTKEGATFKTLGDIGEGQVTCLANEEEDMMQQDTKAASSSIKIRLQEPVSLSFSLKYLNTFAKATFLSDRVRLCLSKDWPMMLEYRLGTEGEASPSFVRYFLAPKIEDDE